MSHGHICGGDHGEGGAICKILVVLVVDKEKRKEKTYLLARHMCLEPDLVPPVQVRKKRTNKAYHGLKTWRVLSSCWPVSPLLMPCCCIRRFHSYTMHDWVGRVGMSGWWNHGSSVVDRLRADALRWSIVVFVVHSNFINKRWISRNK